MNLRQLINSSARVITKHGSSYKNFTETSLGNIIAVDTRKHVDHRLGIIHMLMYITASDTISPVSQFRKRGYGFSENRRQVSTYTTAISFSDYWELDLTFEELLGVENEEDEDLFHSSKFTNINKGEREEYTKRLVKEAEKRLGRKIKDDREMIEAIKKINNEKDIEERRMELLDIKIKNYIRKWAHKSNDVEWQTGRSLGSREVQREYTCQRLYVRNYKYEVEGDIIHIYTPLTIDNKVRVNCTCPHFYYTFAWYNANHQVLIGQKPPAYVKVKNDIYNPKLKKQRSKNKLPETIRNINRLPGICKHLQFFISYLIDNKILQPLNSLVVKNVYAGDKSVKVVDSLIKHSESTGTLGNENKIQTAEKDFKGYLRDIGNLSKQIKIFGEEYE